MQNKSLQEMNIADQQSLVRSISKILNANDLNEIGLTVLSQQICDLKARNVSIKKSLNLKGYVSTKKRQNVDNFYQQMAQEIG